MIRTLAALALTAALITPASALAQSAAPQRYAVELQVIEDGKDVVLARTFIAEGSPASLTLNADKDALDFNASTPSRATARTTCWSARSTCSATARKSQRRA